jgi:hypothetical protein
LTWQAWAAGEPGDPYWVVDFAMPGMHGVAVIVPEANLISPTSRRIVAPPMFSRVLPLKRA